MGKEPPVFGEAGGLAGGDVFFGADGFEFADFVVFVPDGDGEGGHFVVGTVGIGFKAFDEEDVVAHEVGEPAGVRVHAEFGVFGWANDF